MINAQMYVAVVYINSVTNATLYSSIMFKVYK